LCNSNILPFKITICHLQNILIFFSKHATTILTQGAFVNAPGNRNESILLKPALMKLKPMFDKMGLSLEGIVISLDGVYNSTANRKMIFNRKMIPNINLRKCDQKRSGRNQLFDEEIYKERFRTIERLFAWEDKFKKLLIRFERISQHFYAFKVLAYTMINLRHFVTS
jgi:hypothetical protein